MRKDLGKVDCVCVCMHARDEWEREHGGLEEERGRE